MNKYLSRTAMLLMTILSVVLSACFNDDSREESTSEMTDEAKVYFVYTLDTSTGVNMTRTASTNEEVFNEFYAKIKTGVLVAEDYELTLTEVNTGAKYSFKGKWNSHDLVTLRTGTYNVVGTSTAEGENIQERCSFTFDEQIEISITSKVVCLHANYDCSLLIFNTSDIQSLQNYNGKGLATLFTFNTYKYAFVNGLLYDETKRNDAYLLGKYTDNAEFKIYTGNLNFEKGKYYVYNSVSNSFDVPPMEEGANTNREIEGFGRVADAVDLGLSVKWASWNVGASKIADYGGLYGAGDPTGFQTSANYEDYHYNEVTNSTICGTEFDIAKVKWGANWRLPTLTELKELKEKCTWQHNVFIDGMKGSLAKGPNGNEIFFPYAGCREEDGRNPYKDKHASIWSGEQGYAGVVPYSFSYYDLDINFGGSNSVRLDGCGCWNGQSVRPVCN